MLIHKRITAVLLAGVMASGAILPAAAQDNVTLTVTWWGSDSRHAKTLEVIELFEAAHPNISIEAEYAGSGSYFDKLATQVAGGSPPDVMQLGQVTDYATRGALLDLTPYIGEQIDLSNFPEGARLVAQVGGKQFGVPLASNGLGLFYNKALIEGAGAELPPETWTWEEFGAYAADLKTKLGDGQYVLTDRSSYFILFQFFLQQRGKLLYAGDGQVGFDAQDAADWFAMWGEWRDAGLIPSADLAAGYTELNPDNSIFTAGNTAIIMTFLNLLPNFETAVGTEVDVTDLPNGGPDAQSGHWLHPAQSFAISARTQHPEEAATFVNFFVNNEEAADILGLDRGFPASSVALQQALAAASPVEQRMTAQFEETTAEAPPIAAPLPAQAKFESAFILAAQQFSFGMMDANAAGESVLAAATDAAR